LHVRVFARLAPRIVEGRDEPVGAARVVVEEGDHRVLGCHALRDPWILGFGEVLVDVGAEVVLVVIVGVALGLRELQGEVGPLILLGDELLAGRPHRLLQRRVTLRDVAVEDMVLVGLAVPQLLSEGVGLRARHAVVSRDPRLEGAALLVVAVEEVADLARPPLEVAALLSDLIEDGLPAVAVEVVGEVVALGGEGLVRHRARRPGRVRGLDARLCLLQLGHVRGEQAVDIGGRHLDVATGLAVEVVAADDGTLEGGRQVGEALLECRDRRRRPLVELGDVVLLASLLGRGGARRREHDQDRAEGHDGSGHGPPMPSAARHPSHPRPSSFEASPRFARMVPKETND
jgi:hypothetical protein